MSCVSGPVSGQLFIGLEVVVLLRGRTEIGYEGWSRVVWRARCEVAVLNCPVVRADAERILRKRADCLG